MYNSSMESKRNTTYIVRARFVTNEEDYFFAMSWPVETADEARNDFWATPEMVREGLSATVEAVTADEAAELIANSRRK